MLFNSLDFIFFLPVVFLIYWLSPFRYKWVILLIASYYFYMSWNPWFGLLLFGTTFVDYYSALQIADTSDPRRKKIWLTLSILVGLGLLFVFKYFAFSYNSLVHVSNSLFNTSYEIFDKIVIPVGLSFYTFQSLSYTIDVYRGEAKAERNLWKYATFVSFFPQLVAGPIERFNHLMPQFYENHKLKVDMLVSGIRILIWGFFKKMVIADRLAEFVNPVFADVSHYSGITLLITGFFFVVQVYCDFSGYSDIAIGIARLFGYRLSVNWYRPLLSRSLREFWRRNHITMTSWFRDYLYISLGGNRGSYYRWLFNIFLTFVLSGLWHGANWTFVIWGTMHGVVYLIETIFRKKLPKSVSWLGWLYLILFHTISLIAFRANSVSDLFIIYHKILFDGNFQIALFELKTINQVFPLLLSCSFILFLFLKELNEEYGFFHKLPAYGPVLRPAFYVMLFIMIFTFGKFNADEFIYFQF